jgi:hypothetical protein
LRGIYDVVGQFGADFVSNIRKLFAHGTPREVEALEPGSVCWQFSIWLGATSKNLPAAPVFRAPGWWVR